MSQVQDSKAVKIRKPIEKAHKSRKNMTSIVQKIKSRKVPNEATAMIPLIQEQGLEVLKLAQFSQGISFGTMAALAKKQAQEVYHMALQKRSTPNLSRKQTSATTECDTPVKKQSFIYSIKQNLGATSGCWTRPQSAQAVFQ